MSNKTKIITILNEKTTKEYLQQNNIKHIRLFGSTVREEDTDDSDIDLVYEEMDANKIPSRGFGGVYMFLRKKCNVHIDLIAKNEIIDDLKRFIYNDMQLIW